jgi:hypothetical protein
MEVKSKKKKKKRMKRVNTKHINPLEYSMSL